MYADLSDTNEFDLRKIPYSILLLIISAIIFSLQIIPFVGFFLLLMGAPYWSVLLVNGAFAGLVLEVFVRRLPKWLLVLPAVWFGMTTFIAAKDHIALANLRSEMETQNALVNIPFDHRYQSLSFEDTPIISGTKYQIPVTYNLSKTEEGNRFSASYLAPRELCNSIRLPLYSNSGIRTSSFHTESNRIGGGRFVGELCTINLPEQPTLPLVRISSSEKNYKLNGMPVKETIIQIKTPDGRVRIIRGGTAEPYGWLPLIIAGCFPTDSAPHWNCAAGLARSGLQPILSGKSRFGRDGEAVAAALGFEPYNNDYTRPVIAEDLQARVETARDRIIQEDVELLKKVITDPMADIGSVPFGSLRNRPDIIEPHLAGIVSAIEIGMAPGSKSKLNAHQLFDLLEFVTSESLIPYESRLKKLKYVDQAFFWVPEHERVLPKGGVGKTIVVSRKR